MSGGGTSATSPRLVVVYAADSTLAAYALDAAKKILGLRGCSLCDLTHGARGERSEWRACKRALGMEVEVFHRDDAPTDVRAAASERWPVVMLRERGALRLLLDAPAIAAIESPAALGSAIERALETR